MRNRDGSVSTVRTMSIGVDGGEVLIPTVIGGRVVSDEEAIRHFERTGENFGTFNSPDEATAYANALHNYHAAMLEERRRNRVVGRSAPAGFVPPARLTHGAMTSGRRTPEGNRIVGGVAGSRHLDGTAVDYDGPNLPALLEEARRLPGVRKAFIHKGHVHTEGNGWNVPYYGARGTTGLKR